MCVITDVIVVGTDIQKAVINKAIIRIYYLTHLLRVHSVRQYFRENCCEIILISLICVYADSRMQRGL